MTDATARRLARASFGVLLLLLGVGLAAAAAAYAGGEPVTSLAIRDTPVAVATFIFPIVALIIARREPRNPIVWILLGVGLAWQASSLASAYVVWGPPGAASSPMAAALFSWLWVPGIVPLGTFLLLLFPDGHLPTPRWRGWAWFCGLSMVFAAFVVLTGPTIDQPGPLVANPLALSFTSLVEDSFFVLLIPVPIAGCAVALVRRFRRSSGVQRQQLKWLAAAGAFVAVLFMIAVSLSIPYDWDAGPGVPSWVSITQNIALSSFLLFPTAVGIAITRYRLYDIDRLINRALVYGLVSALLGLIYAGSVVGAQNLLRGITGTDQGNLAVAASTLAVAALFGPIRGRVQGIVDRRFNRQRYDAARTVEAFSASLRQQTDLDALRAELSEVVASTVQPRSVTLWLTPGASGP